MATEKECQPKGQKAYCDAVINGENRHNCMRGSRQKSEWAKRMNGNFAVTLNPQEPISYCCVF